MENQEHKYFDEKFKELAENMDKMKLNEYVEYVNNPKRMFRVNFFAGIARGFGMAVGFTILGALVVYVLQWIVRLNLPVIGDFIADIVKLVNHRL